MQSTLLLNKLLFSNFPECYEVVSKKEYKGSPLPELPVSTVRTRSETANTDVNLFDDFLCGKMEKYKDYLGYVINVDELTRQNNFNILESIHFASKSEEEIKQLLFEYRELFEFACTTAD